MNRNVERDDELTADQPADAGLTGSGVRGADGGASGRPTGDSSAEGMDGDPAFGMQDAEGFADEGTSGLEGLTIKRVDDPTLGLTNVGDVPAEDWAADTGPTEMPGRGIVSDNLEDDGSTLARDEEEDEDDGYVPEEEGA